MQQVSIIKIGGNIIDDENNLKKFLSDFSKIKSYKILVHGGGKLASDMSERMGITPKMVDGRRITDAETLKIVTMVYAGWINKSIVALLQKEKCDAIGLSGADANIIPAHKRAAGEIDYGFAGDINTKEISADRLSLLIDAGLTPVIAPITYSNKDAQLLNTNADTIVASLAIALAKKYDVQLVYCFEKNGVLKNIEDDNSVINKINKAEYAGYKQTGIISKGMIPKLDNAFNAIEQGVKEVVIGNANSVTGLINNSANAGTKLVA